MRRAHDGPSRPWLDQPRMLMPLPGLSRVKVSRSSKPCLVLDLRAFLFVILGPGCYLRGICNRTLSPYLHHLIPEHSPFHKIQCKDDRRLNIPGLPTYIVSSLVPASTYIKHFEPLCFPSCAIPPVHHNKLSLSILPSYLIHTSFQELCSQLKLP